MLLKDKMQEIITQLKSNFDFEIVVDEEDEPTERELTLSFKNKSDIDEELIKKIIHDIDGLDSHVVVSMNIVAILIDLGEPHIF